MKDNTSGRGRNSSHENHTRSFADRAAMNIAAADLAEMERRADDIARVGVEHTMVAHARRQYRRDRPKETP